MKFLRTEIPDVVLIEPVLLGDERGYFMETFRLDRLTEFLGSKLIFVRIMSQNPNLES
jgi:dTDP-4-dehydrorhamnose 3,5-epimerase